jgi:hypothetical protein
VLSKVVITTKQGDVLELPLGDYSEGYLVQDIEGLDPVKANLVSSSFANQDGEQYHSSRREKRNIVFKFGIEANTHSGTANELRRNLYKYFMPESEIAMQFYMDSEEFVSIDGVVETFISPRFAKEPEASVSILCFDPDFYVPTPIVYTGVTTWGDIIEAEIIYDGTVETGIVFQITPDQDLPDGLTIFHRSPDNTFNVLEFTEPLSAGDVLDISTVSGAKGATLTNAINGTDSILFGITPQSAWIALYPGSNHIRVYADVEGAAIPYTIAYTEKHGGL